MASRNIQLQFPSKQSTFIFQHRYKELFLSEKLGAFIVPKSLCLISSKPIFTLQKQLLTLIFQKVILQYNSASIQAHSQSPANYIWYLNDYNEEQIRKSADEYLMQRIEFYITVFFNHIYYCEDVDNDIEIEEITEKITPQVYQPDGTKKKRQRKKIVETFFRYRNTKSYGFTLENYSFELLLQSLKPEKIIFLIEALLLERKIILIKDNFGDIAVIMESLVSLLNPLKWNFVFITYLTPKLVECLEAPFPYIIGVSRKIWEDQCVMREFPDDIIIFDIDNQEKLNQIREELPPLPQPQATVLERILKELLDIKERFVDILQKNTPNNLNKEKIDEYYWAYAQLRVKQSFFNFFMLTINNYIGYFKNLDEEGDMSPNKKDKKFYDKLSSNDVFDFDNYINQFSGSNKEYMEKFVKTQSFNNFIEETYKNISPKTHIGFFKTNFEVMLEHSFKRLKKEQNKLIDLTLFNLYNPVKFNIAHMFKQYKKQLLQKHGNKLQKILEEEGDLNTLDQDDQIDLLHRQDLLEKLLIQDVEGNSKKQLSLLNNISQELVMEMPGIQYEHIGAYEQIKSQRSDQSQDRKANKTVVQAPSMSAFEFQQRVKNDQSSDIKSRNYNHIVQSKSGDNIPNFSINQSAGSKPKGGMIYKNYLSMADNKNIAMLQEEDQMGNSMHNATTITTTHNGMTTQEFDMKLISQALGTMTSKNDMKMLQKNRVNSENSFLKNLGNFNSMNKTVIVNSNQHLQRATTTQSKVQSISKTNRIEGNTGSNNMSSSQNLKGLIGQQTQKQTIKQRQTQSPQIISQTQNLCQSAFIGEHAQKHEYIKQQQQSVLKEALNKKIMHQRNKHGLQLKSEDRNNQGMRSMNNLSQSQAFFSPTIQTSKAPRVQLDQQKNELSVSKNAKCIPKTNIDLMNPKNKKISRNEERKLAQKRGFLGFEQHDSFYQFYSPKEELSKLAKMQMGVQKQLNDGNQLTDSKDNINFSNFLSQNYNSNGSDDEQMKNILQQQNKIVFQKRSNMNDSQFVLISNDPLATTINFKTNYIQQKPTVIKDIQQVKFSDPDASLKGPREIKDRKYKLENKNIYDESECTTDNRILKADDNLNSTQPVLMKHPKLRGSESPNVMSSQQNNLSFKHFIDSIKDKGNSQAQVQASKRSAAKQVSYTHKSPTNSKFNQQNSKSGLNQKVTQTFDHSNRTTAEQQKQSTSTILQRKRSSPIINNEKGSSVNTSKIQSKVQNQNPNLKQQQKGLYKQRPITSNQKSNKHQNSIHQTIQIDLERSQKLHQLPPSRIGMEKDMQLLNISPIPNLTKILNNHSVQEDKFTFQQQQVDRNSSSLIDQNMGQKRHNSNFNSRQSEQSAGNTNELMFQSMSQLIEQDLFEKAQLTIGVASNSKHNSNHSKLKYNGKLFNQLSNHHLLKTNSQRSSSIQNQDMKSRASQLSIQSLQRPSQLSLMADLNRQEKELDQMNSARNSDVLSQDAPNSISMSILKSSPKLMNKEVSKIYGCSQLSSLHGNKNFMLQEGSSTMPPSIMTSQDAQNMQSLLNALKQSIPNTTNNSSNVNTVKIDLDRNKKVVFSPKGLGTSKTNIIKQNGKPQLQERVNSIDEARNMKHFISDHQHNTPSIQINKDKQFSSYMNDKKQVKSPQPSSQVLSSNQYLKSLQSQEFQLKEKAKKKYSQAYNTLHQSVDPIISLQKEHKNYYSNNQSSRSNQNSNTLLGKSHNSAHKFLKLDIQDLQNSKDLQHHYSSNQSIQNMNPSKITQNTLSYRSTKNLQLADNKDRLLDEIDGVNQTLCKMESNLKQAKSKNILEEALTSKSNSNSSYQTSPKISSTKPGQQQNSKRIFKTTCNEYKEERLQQANFQDPTVKGNEFPVKKITFRNEDKEQQLQKYNQRFQKQQESSENSEQVIVDFPRQIENGNNNTNSNKDLQNNKESLVDRLSRLNMEIDRLMSEKPSKRKGRGNQTQKHQFSILSNNNQYQTLPAQRGRSQKSEIQMNAQPLIEIRYNSNSNEYDFKPANSSGKISDVKSSNNHQHKQPHSKNRSTHPENSIIVTNNVTSSRHSHALASDKLPHELGNIVLKQQKKRQLRHGLTTCYGLPSKESMQYVKRDLNQDTFCKINSHRGDIDNDPHTPRSNGSLGSIEKKRRKQVKMNELKSMIDHNSSNNLKDDVQVMTIVQNKHTPMRLHSASVDHKDISSPCLIEAAPLQSLRRLEVRDNGNEELFKQQQNQHQMVFNTNNLQNNQRYEVLFDDADLKDTDDKFTSRDINFNRLRNFIQDPNP